MSRCHCAVAKQAQPLASSDHAPLGDAPRSSPTSLLPPPHVQSAGPGNRGGKGCVLRKGHSRRDARLLSKQPLAGAAQAVGVGAPLRPRPPGPCPGGCAAQRGGPAGQECAAGWRAAQEASGGTCKGTSRQQPPSAHTESRGAGVRAERRRVPGRGSGRSERSAGRAGDQHPPAPPGRLCLPGVPGRGLGWTGSRASQPRERGAGAEEPERPQPPALWEPRGRP